MWNLLKNTDEACARFQDALEVSAEAATGSESVERLLAMMPVAESSHAMGCADCRDAAAELLKVRALLRGMPRTEAVVSPWFATRVMGQIEAREAEWTGPASTWIAVPKLAFRLALASFAILLVGSTWLYRKPTNNLGNRPTATAAAEYLFEAPSAPLTQDDVLVSLAENNQ